MLFSIEAHATATPRTAARCIGPRPAFASCDQEAAVLPPWGEGIRYSSRRRSTHVALLTSKSDLTALVFLVKNMLNLRRLGAFVLGASLSAGVVHCDNASVIMQLRKRDLLAHARHIRTNMGFVYGATDDGTITMNTSARCRTRPAPSHRPRTTTGSAPRPASSSARSPGLRSIICRHPAFTHGRPSAG